MENQEYAQDPALPHQRLPYLRVAEEIPRTVSGTVDRAAVRELLLD
jgi:acyl-coenzyme A synthetase/AMP-(fatty) acid ligase